MESFKSESEELQHLLESPTTKETRPHKPKDRNKSVPYGIIFNNQTGKNSFKTSSRRSTNKSLRLVSRQTHKLNIRRLGVPFSSKYGAWYHVLLDYSWWKLFVLLALVWATLHLIFGLLYFADFDGLYGMEETRNAYERFFKCFCFSVQTLSTIGYGTPLAPRSLYSQFIVVVEAYFSLVLTGVFAGFIFTKIGRPTRIARQILFSEVAVVNQESLHYVGGADVLDKGHFAIGQFPVLTIRVANTRKSQLTDTSFRLLLLRRETQDGKTMRDVYEANPNIDFSTVEFHERIHELDFELNHQIGRPRGLNYSSPLLALPWTITHTLNPISPLYGLNLEMLQDPLNHFELIAVLDAVDEGVSLNLQARWSYLPHEIVCNAKFVNMVAPGNGVYDVDYTLLGSYQFLASNE